MATEIIENLKLQEEIDTKKRTLTSLTENILKQKEEQALQTEKYIEKDIYAINKLGENETLNNPSISKENIVSVLEEMSSQGDMHALNTLASCYFTGNYVEKDIDRAIELFDSAAQQDDPVAQRNLAIIFENTEPKDVDKAIELYEKSAKQKDPFALNNLAASYLIGDCVEQDIDKAIKYFEQAAELGDSYAKLNLADCYAVGNGVKQNMKKAYTLYFEAAQLNNPIALKRLAECYMNGNGTKQNFQEAVECYRKAAMLGDNEARDAYKKLQAKAQPLKYDTLTPKKDLKDRLINAGEREKTQNDTKKTNDIQQSL